MALTITTNIIMITSEGNSFCNTEVIADITAAAMRMIIIGSANCERKRSISGVFLPSASLFLPVSAERRRACSEVRPFSVLFTSPKTSEELSR